MTRRDAAILAIRLAAVYAWFQAVEYVAGGIISLFFVTSQAMAPLGGVSPFAIAAYILPCVVMVTAGFFLWLRARVLAHHFVAAEPDTVASSGSASAASLAFAVVGLAVFLYALPRVVSECIALLRSEHFIGRDATPEFLQHLPSLAGSFLQLTCGFFLFIRPHRLASWWERKRDSNVSV
jgi:hypothetical protein